MKRIMSSILFLSLFTLLFCSCAPAKDDGKSEDVRITWSYDAEKNEVKVNIDNKSSHYIETPFTFVLSRLSVRLPVSDLQTLKLLLKALPKPSKKLSARMKRNPSRQSLKKQAQRSPSSNSAYLQKPRLSHGAAALIIVFFLMSL